MSGTELPLPLTPTPHAHAHASGGGGGAARRDPPAQYGAGAVLQTPSFLHSPSLFNIKSEPAPAAPYEAYHHTDHAPHHSSNHYHSQQHYLHALQVIHTVHIYYK